VTGRRTDRQTDSQTNRQTDRPRLLKQYRAVHVDVRQ